MCLQNFRRYRDLGVELRAESILVPGLIDADEIKRIKMVRVKYLEKFFYIIIPLIQIRGGHTWRERRLLKRKPNYLKH